MNARTLRLLIVLALPLLGAGGATAAPSPAAALITQGKADADAGLNILALADWAKAASLDPTNPEVCDARAAFYAARSQWTQAEPDAARAALLSPTPTRCTADADILVHLGRRADAATEYARALSLSLSTGKTAADYLHDGLQCEAQGQTEKAHAFYTQSLLLDPQNPDALRRRMSLWLAWGNTTDALADANSLVTLNLQDPQAYADRAAVLATMNRWKDALADNSQTIALTPQDPSAWLGRGVTYSEQAQTLAPDAARAALQNAVNDFSHALQLDPNNIKALSARGVAFYAQGDYDHALPDLSRAIDLGAGFAVIFLFRGNIFALRHQNALALTDFDRAMQLDPTDPRASAARAAAFSRLHPSP